MSEQNTSNVTSKEEKNIQKLNISDTAIRIVLYGSLFVMFVLCFGLKPISYKYNIIKAETCYASQNYVCAFKFYREAFKLSENNEDYVEHYYETLSKMKKIAVVQEELLMLLENYPDNPHVADIEQIFAQIREQVAKEYEVTYIDDVVQGTSVVHWNNVASKIPVFIDYQQVSKLPDYYVEEVKNSFTAYSAALDNALQFVYVNNPNDAKIQIVFTDDISGGKCSGSSDCVKILGLTENAITGSIFDKSIVQLRTKDTDDSEFTANQIHNIAKHEIGHALGIAGHSYYSEDVMYPVDNDAKWSVDAQALLISKKPFSERDIKTIKLLYRIIPDVSDKSYNSVVHPEMYYPIAVLGTKKEIGEKKLAESKKYMETVSSNFISQMNLAEGYFVSKNFEQAKQAFSDALVYAQSDEEKHTAYHNLAVIYYEERDFKSAINYADMANTFSATGSSNELKAYCYIEMKQFKKAEKVLLRLIEQYPENATYSSALAGAYLKQFKFIKLINEMKRIKEINPEALHEPSYSPYAFFKNFV